MLLLFQYTPPSAAPVISGLNGTNTLYDGQSCTIAGVQFTGASRTITLRQGSLAEVQTELTGSDTELTFTADAAIFAYGTVVLEVTNANGTSQLNVSLVPVSGKAWISADVPWPSGARSVFEEALPAVTDGDQLEYDQVTDNGGVVTMFADGTFTIDDATQGHSFEVRVFDFLDLTWSNAVAIEVNYEPPVTIFVPVDTDDAVRIGQSGAVINGENFGASQGSGYVTIGGVTQTILTWSDAAITFTVADTTPLGAQLLVVSNGTTSDSVAVTVGLTPAQPPVFLGPAIALPALTQGAAITPLVVAARFSDPGGQPLVYSAVGGWPAGLTVTAASGSIQGTPTAAGVYSGLVVRATDTDGLFVDSNTFAITVEVPAATLGPVFGGPSISVPTLTQNTAMTSVVVASRFSDQNGQILTYSARGTWPAGISVSSATGAIFGTPTAVGTSSGLSIRATDPDGNYADSNTFAIVVQAADVVVPPPAPEPEPPPPSPIAGGGVSDVLIANLALTKLGEARIISFRDDSKAARAVMAVYDVLRDAELRRRKWRFALKRAQLPALQASPEFGYAYAYQLPADCLSILAVGDVAPGVDLGDYRTGLDMELYSVEGRTILTDLAAPLKLRYKARITDATQFDAAFVQAFASRLAYELAEDLTQSASKRQQAAEDYKLAIREAVAANAIEVAPTPIPDDSWLLSRV